jgi:hypothetical protein
VLNALFNKPQVVLVDTALGDEAVNSVRSLLGQDHFHAGFVVVPINLSAHGPEGRQLLLQVQRMFFEHQTKRKSRRAA